MRYVTAGGKFNLCHRSLQAREAPGDRQALAVSLRLVSLTIRAYLRLYRAEDRGKNRADRIPRRVSERWSKSSKVLSIRESAAGRIRV